MISIVMSSYQRAPFLDRSFYCYKHQTFKDFEIIFLDDGSTDNTKEIVKHWQKKLNIKYYYIEKEKGLWRDGSVNINFGISKAIAPFIIQTHPEYMPAFGILDKFWELRQDMVYITAKEYILTDKQQKMIDTVPWREGLHHITELPNFYDETELPGYEHRAVEMMGRFETTQFCGMSKVTWELVEGFPPYPEQGKVDGEFFQVRQCYSIPTITPTEKELIGIHQNHYKHNHSPNHVFREENP